MLSQQSHHEIRAGEIEIRYASSAALDAECASSGHAWLSIGEQQELSTWRNPHRRQEWLRSRLLTKQLVADAIPAQPQPQEIEILRTQNSRRPSVRICGDVQPWSLSLSHSSQGVLVALGRQPKISVGADLTDRKPLSDSFLRLWFTIDELNWLRTSAEPIAANILWATKEAIFKACNHGEGFDPRKIEAIPNRYRYRGNPLACRMNIRVMESQFAVVAIVENSNGSHPYNFN